MMSNSFPLNEAALRIESEELLFKLAMSDYAAAESAKLLDEMQAMEPRRPAKDITRLIAANIRRRQAADALRLLVSAGGKAVTKAAVAFLCIMVAFSSTMVISADAREVVFKLLATETERYTQIEMDPVRAEALIDPEVYRFEGAYVPTYMPDGYVLDNENILSGGGSLTVSYYKGGSWIRIHQTSNETARPAIDTENAERTETIIIGDSEALFTIKNYESGDRITQIIWQNGNALLHVYTNADEEEALMVARSLTMLQ